MVDEKQLEIQQAAEYIKVANTWLFMVDPALLREAANDLQSRASWQDSAAVLNPSHPLKKNDLLRLEAKALNSIAEYIENSKEVTKLREEIKTESANFEKIKNLFI